MHKPINRMVLFSAIGAEDDLVDWYLAAIAIERLSRQGTRTDPK